MAQVQFPRALSAIVSGLPKRADVDAQSVGQLIANLEQRWPGITTCLCASRASLRPHINIYVDAERATLETPLREGAIVRILTAVSGG